jgi:hypothetical protein
VKALGDSDRAGWWVETLGQLWWDGDVGEAVPVKGQVQGKSLHFLHNFSLKLKLLVLKNECQGCNSFQQEGGGKGEGEEE